MSGRDRDSTIRRGGTKNRRSRSFSRSRTASRSRSRSYSSRGGAGGGGGRYRRRAEDEDGNPHFSDYYRDRFGSESPLEYQNLRITNIDTKVTNDELREVLERYLGRYGDMNVKVIRQMDLQQRIAYVNFERIGDARDARHGCLQKLVDLLGRRLTVDPAGVVRDQEGRCVKTSTASVGQSPPYPMTRATFPTRPTPFRSSHEQIKDPRRMDSIYPRRQDDRSSSGYRAIRSPSREQKNLRNNSDRTTRRPNDYTGSSTGGGRRGDWLSPRSNADDFDEEASATRTVFVGSLERDITKNDLQRKFSKFGVIEQIDIKTPQEGSAFAFIRFQNLAMAQEAKQRVTGRCGSWKIGYGKPTPSRRLWVGGLRPNTSLAWLEKEFDRFGAIEKIDYVRGENHAYVLFASDEAAMEAWREMKGSQLKDGGERILLQVDFADSSMYDNVDGEDSMAPPKRKSPVSNSPSGKSKDRQSTKAAASSKRPRTPRSSSPSAKQKDKIKKGGNVSSSLRSPRTPPLPISTTGASSSPLSPSLQKSSSNAGLGGVICDGTVSSTTTSPPTSSLCDLAAQNLDELHQLRSPCWTGALVLKKSAYPIRLYKLAGDDDLIDAYLRNERGESVQLTVTQRLKLDQPKEEDVQKWLSSPSDQHAFLLAAANTNVLAAQGNLVDLQPRPLKLLVKYFKEKEAAGVVSVHSNRGRSSSQSQQQNGILYTFPRCPFADLLTSALCPKLAVVQQCAEDCLLVVLQKSAN